MMPRTAPTSGIRGRSPRGLRSFAWSFGQDITDVAQRRHKTAVRAAVTDLARLVHDRIREARLRVLDGRDDIRVQAKLVLAEHRVHRLLHAARLVQRPALRTFEHHLAQAADQFLAERSERVTVELLEREQVPLDKDWRGHHSPFWNRSARSRREVATRSA